MNNQEALCNAMIVKQTHLRNTYSKLQNFCTWMLIYIYMGIHTYIHSGCGQGALSKTQGEGGVLALLEYAK
jgi:hypothetical protein